LEGLATFFRCAEEEEGDRVRVEGCFSLCYMQLPASARDSPCGRMTISSPSVSIDDDADAHVLSPSSSFALRACSLNFVTRKPTYSHPSTTGIGNTTLFLRAVGATRKTHSNSSSFFLHAPSGPRRAVTVSTTILRTCKKRGNEFLVVSSGSTQRHTLEPVTRPRTPSAAARSC
jgi:hypothetical protein